jgi:hypothetical protein
VFPKQRPQLILEIDLAVMFFLIGDVMFYLIQIRLAD